MHSCPSTVEMSTVKPLNKEENLKIMVYDGWSVANLNRSHINTFKPLNN